MAQNTAPIYSQVPVIGNGQLTSSTTANARTDGVGTIGTDLIKCFTANATNGSFVSRLRISATASSATSMGASVFHIYISSATSGATTASTCWLFAEQTAGAQNADNSSTPTIYYEIPINLALPPSYTILVGIFAQPSANTTWQILVFAGDY